MYRYERPGKTSLKVSKTYLGESIEEKIERITLNKEPIKDGAPLVYTDRKDGVRPETDIRTDRFVIATEAHDKIQKSFMAKREQRHKPIDAAEAHKNMKIEEGNDGKTD